MMVDPLGSDPRKVRKTVRTVKKTSHPLTPWNHSVDAWWREKNFTPRGMPTSTYTLESLKKHGGMGRAMTTGIDKQT